MIAAMVVSLFVQVSPGGSALGKEKPWWEKLKPGDMVRICAIPGGAVPIVPMNRWSEAEGKRVRDDINWLLFSDFVNGKKWGELHRMFDRAQLDCKTVGPNEFVVTIVEIREEAGVGCAVAEVVLGGLGEGEHPPETRALLHSFRVPVAYMGRPNQPQHPRLADLPVLVRRSKDISRSVANCRESGCQRMDAIPYAEAERAWKDKQRRAEEIARKAGRR